MLTGHPLGGAIHFSLAYSALAVITSGSASFQSVRKS